MHPKHFHKTNIHGDALGFTVSLLGLRVGQTDSWCASAQGLTTAAQNGTESSAGGMMEGGGREQLQRQETGPRANPRTEVRVPVKEGSLPVNWAP